MPSVHPKGTAVMTDKKADNGTIPRHVAINMDGNNRWARKRLMPGVAGHKAGGDAVRAVIEVCASEGVEVLTLFAFSRENWPRPQDEVGALMELFLFALPPEVRTLLDTIVRVPIIGDRSRSTPGLRAAMAEAEASTDGCTGMQLLVAANYGCQWDITQAARSLARDVADVLNHPAVT